MRLVCTFIFGLLLLSGPVSAGPGHDHGEEASPAETAKPVPRLVSVGSEWELVAVPEEHRLKIYLSEIESNEPVDGASIEVSGEAVPTATAKAIGEGVYEIEGDWVEQPGVKALTFLVSVGRTRNDLLNGTLEISPEAESVGELTPLQSLSAYSAFLIVGVLCALFGFFLAFAFRPVRLPDETPAADVEPSGPRQFNVVEGKRRGGAVAVPPFLGLAVTIGIGVALAGPGHDHGGGHESEVAPAGNAPRKLPSGEVFIPKPSQNLLRVRTAVAKSTSVQSARELVGTVVPDPASEGRVQAPMDGQIELADDGVAVVGQRVKAGDILARLAPAMPVFERGSLEQMAADVEGKLRIAEARLSRLSRIAGVVTQREIEDTQAEVDSLRAQRKVLEPKPAQKLLLRAPVDGIISVASVRPGQVVSARDTLYEIVDPTRLWVEAVGSGGVEDYSTITAAEAVDGNGRSIKLAYLGQSPTLRHHSRPLFFRIDASPDSVAIGATVSVLVQMGEPIDGIILSNRAVVRGSNGLPQVWSKVSPESFKPVPVTTHQVDGATLLIAAGVDTGARIVTEGSELINQVR